jgi:hypothetical protein
VRLYGLLLLATATFLLSGCLYYPETYHFIEPDQIDQPFSQMWAVTDPGFISFSIGDSKRDLRKLRVLHYAFESDAHPIPITHVTYNQIHSRNFAIVRFYYKAGSYVTGAPFKISLSFEVGGEHLQARGTFSTHSHTKIEYLPEVLDHG